MSCLRYLKNRSISLLLAYIFLAVTYCVMGIVIYWAFLDVTPPAIILDIQQTPSKTKENFDVNISLVKLRNCGTINDDDNTVSKFLSKNSNIELDNDNDNDLVELDDHTTIENRYPETKKIGHHKITQSLKVPDNIADGFWYYYFVTNYKCHPFNNILVVSPIAKVKIDRGK